MILGFFLSHFNKLPRSIASIGAAGVYMQYELGHAM